MSAVSGYFREEISRAQRILAWEERQHEFFEGLRTKTRRALRQAPEDAQLQRRLKMLDEIQSLGIQLQNRARAEVDQLSEAFAEACAREAELQHGS